jgi:ABC-2 type transport system permease protein
MTIMISTLHRKIRIYGAFATMVPKLWLAYSTWVWMQFIVQTIALVILVSFWTAVYGSGETISISGLELNQTLNYIILAQIFLPIIHAPSTIFYFGQLMREGQVGIELLRPIDFQIATYVRNVAEAVSALFLQIPLALVGWLIYQYRLPSNPIIWVAFIFSLLLGNAVVFFFDWILSCISFYSTETWGLSVLRFGFATFFSGALVPIAVMPAWLQKITTALPFSHALYIPVSLLSGITPLQDMPRIWLIELAYLIGLLILSRIIFNVSVRKVTVQGG